MSRIFFALFLLTFFSSCEDKVDIDANQAKTFNKIFGNAGQDLGKDIVELEDGSFLIFGSIEVANKGTDLAVIKTDRFGNQLWQTTHGSSANEVAGGFDINSNGNILIVGTIMREEDSTGSTANLADIVVYELDNQGQMLNQQIFDNLVDNEKATCILYDQSGIGGYIIGGSTDAERAEFGSFLANPKGNLDVLIIRYNENASPSSEIQVLGFDGDDDITDIVHADIQEGGESKFWLTGYRTSPNLIKENILFRIENNNKAFDIFEDLPSTIDQSAKQIIIDSEGFWLVGTQNEGNLGSEAVFIKRIDKLINTVNEFTIAQASNSFRGNGISYDDKTGNFIVCGTTNLTQNGGFDHYIASLKVDGTIDWQRTFGGSGDEEALSITTTSDGGYIIAGYTGFEGNGLMNVIKTNNLGILNP